MTLKKRLRKKSKKAKHSSINQIPGTVTYIGEKKTTETSIEIINYTKETYEKKTTAAIKDAFNFEGPDSNTWINLNGLNNTKNIEILGKHYGLHPLVLEDIANTDQRPKIDEFEDYLFIVARMLYHDEREELINEHICLVLGKNYVISFQESDGDVFEGVRERLARARGRVRNSGGDYLIYALIDAIIDNYFVIIDQLEEKVESLEDKLFLERPDDDIVFDIQTLKREIIKLRRAIYPLREVTNRLEKSDSSLIDVKTKNYLGDLHDHIIQVSENIEIYREMIWGLMDMYMTTISNRMNEVMKVLTIMASIFIPLTFLAGIYGMNFDNMPELHYKYSYYILIGVMVLVFCGMIWYFKRKKWL